MYLVLFAQGVRPDAAQGVVGDAIKAPPAQDPRQNGILAAAEIQDACPWLHQPIHHFYALTRFDGFCGFRAVAESARLFEALGVAELEPYLVPLFRDSKPGSLRTVFSALMTADPAVQRELASRTARACEHPRVPDSGFEHELAWAHRIAALYPGDIGLVGALLLNLVRLSPGQAMYLPPGSLHAYLQGMAVEIMASSDNVLRGVFTPKHVDVPELLHILDFRDGPYALPAIERRGAGLSVFVTDAAEFELSVLEPAGRSLVIAQRIGPEMRFCAEGSLTACSALDELVLERGQSVFLPASDGDYQVGGLGRGLVAAVRAA